MLISLRYHLFRLGLVAMIYEILDFCKITPSITLIQILQILKFIFYCLDSILHLSYPEIAIKKSIVISGHFIYVKRSQRDYSMSLRLQIVGEIERGELSATSAQHKYGIQGRSTVINWLRKYGNLMGLPKLEK